MAERSSASVVTVSPFNLDLSRPGLQDLKAADFTACSIDWRSHAIDFTAEQPRKLRAAALPPPKL